MKGIEKVYNKECSSIVEKLNNYFNNISRVKDIQLDRVKTTLKDGRYLLLNLTIDSRLFHSEIRTNFEETDDEIFNQIVKDIKKFIMNLDREEKLKELNRRKKKNN